MTKLSSKEFVSELGIKVPGEFLDNSEHFDPKLAKVLKEKMAQSISWEDLLFFFEDKHLPPCVMHEFAKALKVNPAPINRTRKPHKINRKRKHHILKKAEACFDEATIESLKKYLGIGLKAEIRDRISTAVASREETESNDPIDLADPLLDLVYEYLEHEIRIAADKYGGSEDIDLENITPALPYLVVETTRENVNQATLPL